MRTKVCITCHVEKPIDDFAKSHGGRPGGKCRSCSNAYMRAWWVGKPRPWRRSNNQSRNFRFMLQKFGLTRTDYEALLERQDHACAICRKPASALAAEVSERRRPRRLGVDHDHVTGQVRGLLCVTCNSAIAHLKEDPVLFQRALEYLAAAKAVNAGR